MKTINIFAVLTIILLLTQACTFQIGIDYQGKTDVDLRRTSGVNARAKR